MYSVVNSDILTQTTLFLVSSIWKSYFKHHLQLRDGIPESAADRLGLVGVIYTKESEYSPILANHHTNIHFMIFLF